MAGIGFELRKLIGRGSLGSFVKGVFSAVMIVAGPWLLSILSLFLISRFLFVSQDEDYSLFMAALIYCYSFSLIFFGGFHYLFTRIIADLLFENRECEASHHLLGWVVSVALISGVIALGAMIFLPDKGIAYGRLFKGGFILLFVSVNTLWVIMLFISMLKWYLRILLVYMGGILISLVGIWYMSGKFSVSGALTGYGLGHLFICLLLLLLSVKAFPPEKSPYRFKKAVQTLGEYRYLFFTGLFYYSALWCDKIYYWFTRGTRVSGTYFYLYQNYDTAVYLANLIIIPGLVYFVVISETSFFIQLKRFLLALGSADYLTIQKRKHTLIRSMEDGVKEQSLSQLIITLILFFLSPWIYNEDLPVFYLTLFAVFFQLLFLTFLNYLFYLELYSESMKAVLLMIAVNSVIMVFADLTGTGLPGLSYLISGAAASLYSRYTLISGIYTIDRRILIGK